MSFKKPTAKTGKNAAVLIGGVIGGVMLSRVAIGLIDDPAKNPDPKKAEQATMLKQIGMVAAGGVLAASVTGTDSVADLTKAAGAGFAVAQALELIKNASAKGGVADEATATTTGKKAVARALGLGCNCSNMGLGRRRRRGLGEYGIAQYAASGMDSPVITNNAVALLDSNPLLRAMGAA